MTIRKPSITIGDTQTLWDNRPKYYHLDHLARPGGGADECSVLNLTRYLVDLRGEL